MKQLIRPDWSLSDREAEAICRLARWKYRLERYGPTGAAVLFWVMVYIFWRALQ